MLKVIFYIVWFMNIICVITNCKSKILNIVSFLTLMFVFGGNTANADYAIYEREYYLIGGTFENGYELLTQMTLSIGLTYNQFLFLTGIVMYGIVFYVYSKYSKNYAVFYTIYFSVFLFYDIIQMRNYMCMVFLMLACNCLVANKRVKAFLIILIAAQFQMLAYIYLPLVFLDLEKKQTKRVYEIAVVLIFAACILIFINGNEIPFLDSIFSAVVGGDDSIKMYYLSNKVRLGFLLSFALQFMNVGLVYFANLIARKVDGLEDHKRKFLNVCFSINLYGFIAFPMVMINHNFYRIFRNLCVLDMIAAAIIFDVFARNGRYKLTGKNMKFVGYMICYCIVWAVGIMYKYSDFTQINTILTNNMFFRR